MEQIILFVLVLTSIISVTFIIERGMALRWQRIIPPLVREAAGNCRTTAELPMLHRICEQQQSPLSRLLLVAATHLDCPRAENVDALQTKARHEVAQMERGLVVLEIVTGIAPLMGLVGTVFGLIKLFQSLGTVGPADNAAFAGGIAIALQATLMGLMIAIPSLVSWSYYSKKIETQAVEMETLCDEFLRRHYREDSGNTTRRQPKQPV